MPALNLRPSHVYFLGMLDESGSYDFPYVKVGITDGSIRDRIRALQTGNPFPIRELGSFHSEAAMLVEHNLHHRLSSKRASQEWFRVSADELDALIGEARDLSGRLSEKAAAVRGFDATPSSGDALAPTPEVADLRQRFDEVRRRKIQATARMDIAKFRLQRATGNTGGIEGITRVSITQPRYSFKKSLLKQQHPDVYEAFCRVEEMKVSFRLLKPPTIRAFPELGLQKEEASADVPDVSVDEADVRQLTGRSAVAEELHANFLLAKAALAEIEQESLGYELDLRHLAGLHCGIEGVCSYERKPTLGFDEAALTAERPELWQQCHEMGTPSRRINILGHRDYVG